MLSFLRLYIFLAFFGLYIYISAVRFTSQQLKISLDVLWHHNIFMLFYLETKLISPVDNQKKFLVFKPTLILILNGFGMSNNLGIYILLEAHFCKIFYCAISF